MTTGRRDQLTDFADRVLDVVDAIPPGQVMSYGDIAEYLGQGGPRQVGRVMSLWGGGVAWWRVIHADGSFLPGHEREALAHYREEGTPLRGTGPGGGLRVDMRKARREIRVGSRRGRIRLTAARLYPRRDSADPGNWGEDVIMTKIRDRSGHGSLETGWRGGGAG